MAWIIKTWEDLAELGMVLVANSTNDPSVLYQDWQPLQRLFLDECHRLQMEETQKKET